MSDTEPRYCKKALISGILMWLCYGYIAIGIWQANPKDVPMALIISVIIALIVSVISFSVGIYYLSKNKVKPSGLCPLAALVLILGIALPLSIFYDL